MRDCAGAGSRERLAEEASEGARELDGSLRGDRVARSGETDDPRMRDELAHLELPAGGYMRDSIPTKMCVGTEMPGKDGRKS